MREMDYFDLGDLVYTEEWITWLAVCLVKHIIVVAAKFFTWGAESGYCELGAFLCAAHSAAPILPASSPSTAITTWHVSGGTVLL